MKAKSEDLSKGVPTPDDLNQTRKVDPSKDGTNQLRTIGLMEKSSDFDHIDQENPFTKMASNPCGGSQHTGKAR